VWFIVSCWLKEARQVLSKTHSDRTAVVVRCCHPVLWETWLGFHLYSCRCSTLNGGWILVKVTVRGSHGNHTSRCSSSFYSLKFVFLFLFLWLP